MDFMADRLDNDRRIRIFTIKDAFTGEHLAAQKDSWVTSGRVVEALAHIAPRRGGSAAITVDDGSKLYSRGTTSWAYGHGVVHAFHRPRKPMESFLTERFK